MTLRTNHTSSLEVATACSVPYKGPHDAGSSFGQLVLRSSQITAVCVHQLGHSLRKCKPRMHNVLSKRRGAQINYRPFADSNMQRCVEAENTYVDQIRTYTERAHTKHASQTATTSPDGRRGQQTKNGYAYEEKHGECPA